MQGKTKQMLVTVEIREQLKLIAKEQAFPLTTMTQIFLIFAIRQYQRNDMDLQDIINRYRHEEPNQ